MGEKGEPRQVPDSHRAMWIALILIVGFMVAEVTVSAFSGSLALLADAGHMLTDAGAIGAAIWASGLAKRPANSRWTFGLPRAEIVAAAVNGMTLLVAAGLVVQTSIKHLIKPPKIAGLSVLIVACIGIVVNLIATWLLRRSKPKSLNQEAVLRHIFTDLSAFIATAIAAGFILTTGFERADAIASLLVVVLMLHASIGLLRESGKILLEGTPDSVDLENVRNHILELPEVVAIHDLHAWTLTSHLPVLSAHVVIHEGCFMDGSAAQILDRLQACLVGHFDLEHSTFQLEPETHLNHEAGVHN